MTGCGRVARGAVVGLLAYWLVYCLVAVANVTDAHYYNQARLYVIGQGGLLHNEIFHSAEQIAYPWTYDAIHWPFLCLGFGHPLPGWLCLVATIVIVHGVAREHLGADGAWLCCLALLAMPAVVYQATSTKNDFPMIFGVFCWYWALRRFQRERRRIDLVASAVAAAFAGGVKVTGLLFAPLLVAASVAMLRRDLRALRDWIAAAAVAGLLLLSVETYVASWLTFGHWLGPFDGYAIFRNRDGLQGTLANVVRFAFLNVDVGADALLRHESWLTALMEHWCRALLDSLGLSDRGWMVGMPHVLDFTKSGHEATAGYGPLGTLGVLLVPIAAVIPRPREPSWRLAVAALATFGILSASVGWEVYNDRRLVLPFALAGLAVTVLVLPAWRSSRGVRLAFVGLLLYGAVWLPLTTSFNRKPSDLWLWVTQRDRITMREQPHMLPVVRRVRELVGACPSGIWLVTAAPSSWELIFYEILGDRAIIDTVKHIAGGALSEIGSRFPGRGVYVLAIGQSLWMVPGLEELNAFPGPLQDPIRGGTRIYRFGSDDCGAALQS